MKTFDNMMVDLGDSMTEYILVAIEDHPVRRIAISMFYIEKDEMIPIAIPLVQRIVDEGLSQATSLELGRLVVAYLLRTIDESYPVDNTISGMVSLVPGLASRIGRRLRQINSVARGELRTYLEI